MKSRERFKSLFTFPNLVLFGIIVLSVFFRFWELSARSGFDSDQEVAAWTAKQLLIDHKPTLLGVITSSGNIFLGPLYFYLYALPMIFTKMNPIGQLFLSSLVGVVTTIVFYLVGKNLFSQKVGLAAAFIHAVSLLFSNGERPIWNVSPVLLICVLIYWCYFKISIGIKKYWLYLLALMGLLLHFHLTGIFFIPTTVIFFLYLVLVKKTIAKRDLYYILWGVLFFGLLLSPLLFFDLRHNFMNSRNILVFFLEGGGISKEFFVKIPHSFLDEINILSSTLSLPWILGIFVFLAGFILLAKRHTTFFIVVFILFLITSFGFSLFNGQITSYYYLLLFPPAILGISLLLDYLFSLNQWGKLTALLFVCFLLYVNSKEFFRQTMSFSFATKEKVVKFITTRAKNKPYYVSYSIEYGRNFGFKYLFWQSKKEPSTTLIHPIYTIVLPDNFGGIKPDLKINDIGIVLPKDN